MVRQPEPPPTSDQSGVLSYGRGRTRDRRVLRAVLVLAQGVLIVGVILTFRRSLFLPAGYGDLLHNGSQTGLQCLLTGFWLWPSNMLLLLSPVAAFALLWTRDATAYVVLAIFYLVSGAWVVYAGLGFLRGSIALRGDVLWLCAHVLATAAILVPTWAAHPARTRQ